jgi:DNA sulfur modification protein DndE
MKNLIIACSILTMLFAFRPADEKPTIFLCGDSTMAHKAPKDTPETGWGMVLPEYFTDAIRIENHAVNGRSTKSFRTLGHWKSVMDKLKAGDYVILQFGHNDQKKEDSLRYAAPQTNYKQNLKRFVEEIQKKGAIPILATPISRRKFDETGQFIDQHGDYPAVVRALANELNLPLLDMHAKSHTILIEHGVEASKKIYLHLKSGEYPKYPKGVEDNTHFSPYGAKLMASLAVQCLIDIKHPLTTFMK